MEPIKSSELITNADGSIFHLHLHPEDLAEQVILVGDPSRVEMIASYFEKIDIKKSDREFCTITGYYKGHRLSVISTGIGADNIDIVMNECFGQYQLAHQRNKCRKEDIKYSTNRDFRFRTGRCTRTFIRDLGNEPRPRRGIAFLPG